jgi:nucleotide-binding universal stress UspA family protein
MARDHGAGLTALYCVEQSRHAPYLDRSMTNALVAFEQRCAHAEEMVADVAESSGIPIKFIYDDGEPATMAVRAARLSDLVVVGQWNADDPGSTPADLSYRLLMGGGRPVLFAPHSGEFENCGTRVVISWNATRESARAVSDALPILTRAAFVEAIQFSSNGAANEDDERLGGLSAYLAAHGISAGTTRQVPPNPSISERILSPTNVDASFAEMLLSHAADLGADLVVMGGYGHSRGFELILGGMTRTFLASMPIPVLMSH